MSFFDEVEDEVRSFRADGVGVRGFRLALAETVSAELGMEANRAGSPYAPLSVKALGGGSFVIQWDDGLLSAGSLSRAPREALRETLAAAAGGRYDDPDDAAFPEPAPVPTVPLFSPGAAAVARGDDPDWLPATIGILRGVGSRCGARLLDASARAAHTRRRVVTSGGFTAEAESTSVDFGLALDSLVWDGFSRRETFAAGDVEALSRLTVLDYETLRAMSPSAPRGLTRVVLHPRVSEQFLRAFLFANLSGGAVANGRSRFRPADFAEGLRAFREDLSIAADPLRPLSPGSFTFSDEGVPARAFPLVAGGRLRSPTLSLKHARRLSLPPAPAPAEIEGWRIDLANRLTRAAALGSASEVLLVHSVLGMHTQDPARGDYSLLCPQGALWRDGKAAGRASATLNGSFFRDLCSEGLALVDFEGFSCPGLMLDVALS